MDIDLQDLYRGLFRDMLISKEDSKYILKRLASEGVVFATQELPKIAKALIHSLEVGYFDRAELTSFKFKLSTLVIFQELFSSIFDFNGRLLASPCADSIRTIRQVCEYLYKLCLPFTKEQIEKSENDFVRVDSEIAESSAKTEVVAFASNLRKDFETYWSSLASTSASEILKSCRPRSTSGTFVGSGPFYFIERESTFRLGYPSDLGGYSGYYKQFPGLSLVKSKLNPITVDDYSELLLVPKDSRGPRTICREDLHRVETQMAFFDYVTRVLTRESNGAINFLDQTVNRRIAEKSSVTKEYATLDLKEASDRVSYSVIKTVFRNSPGLRFFLTGSRRASKVLVRGSFYKLNKLAGMGSGLTFPSMSLLISLAICNVVRKRTGLPYADIRKDVFVYGDDICVPRLWVPYAVQGLSLIGLVVNESKSFRRGFFRESCGGDYYAGVDVAPSRLRLSNSKPIYHRHLGRVKLSSNANAYLQLYEHCKELFSKGMTHTCKYLMTVCNTYYESKFGLPMRAGIFDMKCPYPLNFTIGDKHLHAEATSVVYAVRPEQIKGLDSRKIVDERCRPLQLDPLRALGRSLAGGQLNPVGDISESTLTQLLSKLDSLDTGKDFGDITIPRKQTFVRRSISNREYASSPVYSREEYYAHYCHSRSLAQLAYIQLAIVNAGKLVAKYHEFISCAKKLYSV